MKPIFEILFLSVAFVLTGHGQWIKQTVDSTASLRGLSVVNEKVVWASGTGGTVIKTTDGGKTWNVITVPGAGELDFRDIEAFDAKTAYILSIGKGESSRIYKTTDGGTTWKEQFRNKNEKAFFDAIACWDRTNCIAMSDPVDGKFLLIETKNGESWSVMDSAGMPPAKEGEAAFAASGTCLITQGKNNAFLVSGGSAARVFRTNDRGKTWHVSDTPIIKGTPGSGIFSIAMRDGRVGAIVGGNYESPTDRNYTFATTGDGGVTWRPGSRPNGYRSSVAIIDKETLLAVGPSGTDISYDRGDVWDILDKTDLNAVSGGIRDGVWAVGRNGTVLIFDAKLINKKYSRAALDSCQKGSGRSPSVTGLSVSHSEIASNCSAANSNCSSIREIEVRSTAVVLDCPHEFLYTVSGGKIVGDGHTVKWDLSGVSPGTYSISSGLSIPSVGDSWQPWGGVQTKTVLVR